MTPKSNGDQAAGLPFKGGDEAILSSRFIGEGIKSNRDDRVTMRGDRIQASFKTQIDNKEGGVGTTEKTAGRIIG